jgi:hypothetical protein
MFDKEIMRSLVNKFPSEFEKHLQTDSDAAATCNWRLVITGNMEHWLRERLKLKAHFKEKVIE